MGAVRRFVAAVCDRCGYIEELHGAEQLRHCQRDMRPIGRAELRRLEQVQTVSQRALVLGGSK